jgi:hypothetical protein
VIYALILLQILDIASTHYALKSGIGAEGNPVLRKLFDRFGHEPVLLAIKGAFIALLWWAVPIIEPSPYFFVVYLLVALYVWVVFNNVKIIMRHHDRN